MRVICIDDSGQNYEEGYPHVKRGRIYTVMSNHNEEEKIVVDEQRKVRIKYVAGEYYTLAEMGDEPGYHSSMFMVIEEDQQDETEFERNYEKEKIKQ